MMNNVTKRASSGFILSLIAGIIILVNSSLSFFGLSEFTMSMGVELPFVFAATLTILWVLGTIFGFLVIIGAILIYIPGKETVGGTLAIIFSLFSIVIGGGYFIGLILGIIGGILGLKKK